MIRHLLSSRNLFGRPWRRIFLSKKISYSREILSVSCYLSNYYCSRKLILSFIDQHYWFAWSLGAANLIAVEILFSLFLDMKIWASCACILNSKSAAPGPIWLKFGQVVARRVTYKIVSANLNSSFHFKLIGNFSLAVAMIAHPRIYSLVKMKRRHIREIWDTVFSGPVHTNPFSNENGAVFAIFHTTTPKTITENGVIRKRSPEWSDLKTMLFENAVF